MPCATRSAASRSGAMSKWKLAAGEGKKVPKIAIHPKVKGTMPRPSLMKSATTLIAVLRFMPRKK
jgi:hypothetical protein